LEGRAILWTYFKMGLRGQKGPRLNARVCYQSPYPFSASPTCQVSGSTLYCMPTQIMGQRLSMPWQRTQPPPPLDKAGKKFIQEVCGVFLFLARGVNGSLLPALSALASQQANPTEHTLALCKQFLDYMASQDEAALTYKASNMVLAIQSDTSYLSKLKACSRAGGHMFMAGRDDVPTNNGAVLNILQIIRAVMSSATDAELGALFINAKTAVSMCHTLKDLGHPQPPTPMQTDNIITHDLHTNKIMPKALMAMDLCFHWLRC
jgi:hypothetical protein